MFRALAPTATLYRPFGTAVQSLTRRLLLSILILLLKKHRVGDIKARGELRPQFLEATTRRRT
jgi:hypothetical protein